MVSEFAQEISRIPLLTKEDEQILVEQFKNGSKEARELLIHHNMRLVLKLAYQYMNVISLPLEDLIVIGSFGLMRAVDRFDASHQTKLGTLAYPCIINEFKRYIYLSKMKKRDDTWDISLQEEVYQNKDGDGITREATLVDPSFPLEEQVIEKCQRETVTTILKRLTKDEREVLYLRYGIQDGICHTLEEIGELKNLTRERIRQKEASAIKKLKHPTITRQLKDF